MPGIGLDDLARIADVIDMRVAVDKRDDGRTRRHVLDRAQRLRAHRRRRIGEDHADIRDHEHGVVDAVGHHVHAAAQVLDAIALRRIDRRTHLRGCERRVRVRCARWAARCRACSDRARPRRWPGRLCAPAPVPRRRRCNRSALLRSGRPAPPARSMCHGARSTKASKTITRFMRCLLCGSMGGSRSRSWRRARAESVPGNGYRLSPSGP